MLLLIDTSEISSIVALGNKQGKIIDIRKNITKLKLSQTLLSEINLLLERNRVSLKGLKGIIVIQGPGSFTGLRVGTSVANSLGYGLKTPVAGIRKSPEEKPSAFCGASKVQSMPRTIPKGSVRGPKLKISYKSILKKGLKKLRYAKPGKMIRPFYGEKPHATVKE